MGSLQALETIVEDFAWCTAPDGRILPPLCTDRDGWARHLQLCSPTDLALPDHDSNLKGQRVTNTEHTIGQIMLTPVSVDNLVEVPMLKMKDL